jgi:hypothetical protein
VLGVAVGADVGWTVGAGVNVAEGVGGGCVVAVGLALMTCPPLPGKWGCVGVLLPLISKTRPIVKKTPQPKPKAMPMRKVSHCLGGEGGGVGPRGWRVVDIAFLPSGKQ